MILECPTCQARFLVADALIPSAGRTVRCGSCTHQWFVQPTRPPEVAVTAAAEQATLTKEVTVDFATLAERAAESPEASAPKLEGDAARKVPVIKKRNIPVWPFMLGASVLAASWLTIALIGHFPTWQYRPELEKIYASLGVTDTQGLVFNTVSIERREEKGGRTQFILKGSIANHADSERMLPEVRVALRDKAGETVWSRKYPVHHVLKVEEVYPFGVEDIKIGLGDRVATIVVDLGHPMELSWR